MLKLGDKNIKKLYQGDKLITKMCLGDKLIYHKQPTLLEYIEFDGQSYINTGICATTNTRVEATFYATVQHTGFYGVYTTYKRLSSYINGSWRFGNTDTSVRDIHNILVDSIHDKNGVVINGKLLKYSATPAEFVGKDPMFLGWTNECPISWDKFQGKLYKFKVYESDVLVGDFKPCINPNGIVCFYDTVTKKYFYNIGTGQFKAGGRFVKSILFDGASYIDTGITHQNCEFETRTKFYNIGVRQIQGYALSTAMYWECRIDGRIDGINNTNGFEWNKINIIYDTSNTSAPTCTTVINDELTSSATGRSISSRTYVFGCCQQYYWMQGEVEYYKCYIGGTLIQDLRPFVDENEVACFYDMVTGTKFYNQGTGTLGYTEE